MKNQINLFFDKSFDFKFDKLISMLNESSKYLKFNYVNRSLNIASDNLKENVTHQDLYNQLTMEEKNDYLNFFFTGRPYANNYFFESYENLVPTSFFAWERVTSLPKSNGVVYFIVDYLSLTIDKSSFRHQEKTGCIYDFLWDKTGVDDGMRQARFCRSCLERIEQQPHANDEILILHDIQTLMNILSDFSKWNKDVLQKSTINPTKKNSVFTKRGSKKSKEINVLIASPGDLAEERELLLTQLERKFRVDLHENNCNHRLIVHGWEDLAAQIGYAQDIINERIITNVDVIIAVFKHRLGTPTINPDGSIRAESGTAEEILKSLDNSDISKPFGMVYFNSKAPSIPFDSPNYSQIKTEWEKLQDFKNTIRNKVLYKPFADKNELLNIVTIDLHKNILDYFN